MPQKTARGAHAPRAVSTIQLVATAWTEATIATTVTAAITATVFTWWAACTPAILGALARENGAA